MKESVFFDFLKENGIPAENKRVKNIVMDSKKIESGDIFIAIRGGNNYIKEAFVSGASFVVYDNQEIDYPDQNAIKVKDSVEFLQKMVTTSPAFVYCCLPSLQIHFLLQVFLLFVFQ